MSEPDEGMAKHVVVTGVDRVVDLSSLGHNAGPVETECIGEQVGGMAEHAVVVEVNSCWTNNISVCMLWIFSKLMYLRLEMPPNTACFSYCVQNRW
jgi:hypothetical protein